jgi:retron-type reverse transcriptase
MLNNVYAVLSQNTDILEDAKRNKSAYLKEWKSIPWRKIEQSIYKLQCDIACAEIDENYKKARNLQRILLSKDSALLYSIKRVTMFNRGYKTPGVDGMIIKSHPERMALFYNLKSKNLGEYKPLPARRVYIDKANGYCCSLNSIVFPSIFCFYLVIVPFLIIL